MGNEAGPANCCLAQMVLGMKGITKVAPGELADMIGVGHVAAGFILKDLNWRRESTPHSSNLSVYFYEGPDKDFHGGAVSIARIRLSRILGISKEELLEVAE